MNIFKMFRVESPDFTEVDAAQDRARKGLNEAEARRIRATHVAQRAKWSRDTNHFSEGMAAALRAPRRNERHGL